MVTRSWPVDRSHSVKSHVLAPTCTVVVSRYQRPASAATSLWTCSAPCHQLMWPRPLTRTPATSRSPRTLVSTAPPVAAPSTRTSTLAARSPVTTPMDRHTCVEAPPTPVVTRPARAPPGPAGTTEVVPVGSSDRSRQSGSSGAPGAADWKSSDTSSTAPDVGGGRSSPGDGVPGSGPPRAEAPDTYSARPLSATSTRSPDSGPRACLVDEGSSSRDAGERPTTSWVPAPDGKTRSSSRADFTNMVRGLLRETVATVTCPAAPSTVRTGAPGASVIVANREVRHAPPSPPSRTTSPGPSTLRGAPDFGSVCTAATRVAGRSSAAGTPRSTTRLSAPPRPATSTTSAAQSPVGAPSAWVATWTASSSSSVHSTPTVDPYAASAACSARPAAAPGRARGAPQRPSLPDERTTKGTPPAT
jgi:hypothetical protein